MGERCGRCKGTGRRVVPKGCMGAEAVKCSACCGSGKAPADPERQSEQPIYPTDREQMWRDFGAAVRLARKGTGFTMGEVARRLGVSVSVISALETGDTETLAP